MRDFHTRTVFFVTDAQRSLSFYTATLGFSLDWNFEDEGRSFIFQVNLFGLELIVNQTEVGTKDQSGHGRLFVGFDDDQIDTFRQHIEKHSIETTVVGWGEPTIVIRDPDGNELFFWLTPEKRESLKIGQRWP